MTNIKITELSNIGGNIAANSLVPVVDMSGTPTTKKANLQVVGNLMLSGAGGANFAPAGRAILSQTVTNAAQPNITSVGTLTGLAVTGNITAGNISGNIVVAVANLKVSGGTSGYVLQTDGAGNLSWTAQTGGGGGNYSNANVANYLPTFIGTVGANRISSNAASGNNLQISANGAVFTFNSEGEFTAPGNVNLQGTRLNVGPGAANVPITTNPTLVVTDDGLEFIQAALLNENPNGSSDYAAYGAGSDETQGFADLGFAGPTFNDPNYSITPPGDGYVFVQGYANGLGGALTLATGQNGNTPDIVFATGGFISGAEFGRIDHADNVLYLSRSGSGIKFSDGSIQTTAGLQDTGDITFNGPNISTDIADGNINVIGSTSGNILLSSNNHIFLHVDDSIDPHGGVEMTWARTSNGVTQTAGISINSDFGNNEVATGNVQIVACGNLAEGLANSSWTFGTDGKLAWPGIGAKYLGNSAAGEFEIHSDANVVIGTDIGNSDRLFVFDQDGDFYAPGNVTIDGTQVFVGTGANTLTSLLGATLVISSNSNSYVQSVINNVSDIGSADWVAQGRLGGDEGGYVDLGFNSSEYDDPEYSSMGPGDGYLYTEGYAEGQAPSPTGGNLVIGTGSQGLTRDIIFTTGGHTANDIIARFSDANNAFELSRANAVMKFPDGSTQSTAYTGGVGSELVNGNNSFVLDADGNVVFEGNVAGNAVNRGLVWDYGANANGVNSMVRQDNGGLTVRAWTENGGGANGYSAPVNIITNQDANTNVWLFDGQGNLTVPSGSINSINDGGDLGAYLTLTPDIGLARLAGRTLESTVNYTSANWTSATYTGTQINIVDAPQLVIFFTENQFNVGVNQTISINGDEPVLFTGYTIGTGNDVIVYTDIAADPDPTTVTSIDFYYQLESYVAVDYDDGTLNINATGLTINIDNDQTSGPDINLRSGDDITLQAKDKALGSESEGGDINILAGDGADDDGAGNTASTGGDIIIDAGRGGDGNSSSGSTGGFTTIRGGAGGSAGVTSAAGPGGYVNIEGGDGGTDGGNTSLGGVGGNVSITAGLTRQEGVNGSNVVISSGQAGPNALAGNVEIFTPASANGFGGTWTFDGNGKLTFPGTPRIDTYTNNFEVQAAESINFEANAVVNIYTDTGNAAYQWQFGDDGNLILAGGNSVIQSIANSSLDPTLPNVSTMTLIPDANYNSQVLVLDPTAPGHIHLRAFASSNIDEPSANIFLGGEDTSFEITSGANNQAVIHSGGYDWTFGNDGTLTVPFEGLIRSFDDTIVLQSVDTGTGNANSVRLATDGSLYFEGTEYLNGWFQIANDSGDANIVSPSGNISITPAFGVANAAGKSLTLQGGAADQSDFYTGTGGAVNITGGLGSSDDGGGGGPGGNINITSGNSSDPAGHAGNINITAGSNGWVFDYTGNLTLPGDLIAVSASPAPSIRGFSSVSALQFTNGNSNVTVNANSNLWNFDSTGNLIIPGSSGGFIKTVSNASIGIAAVDNGTNNPAQLLSLNSGSGAATSIVSAYSTNVAIQTDVAGTMKTWSFANVGVTTNPVLTVDALPTAVAGMRAFVSDANLAPVGNFGAIVGNSGSNTVSVWSDGTNWRIG